MKTYLAVDIGASGGRHMLGWVQDGHIHTEEIYRFENGMQQKDGQLLWDVERLVKEIIIGMQRAGQAGHRPVSVGIDTWGVDFALLDAQGNVVGDTVAYRDSRTDGMDTKLEQTLPFRDLYARTGTAKQPFNTLYQLMAVPKADIEKAQRCLLLPEYFAYRLCGVMGSEYTIASTTALLNAQTRDWDREVLRAAGIPDRLFPQKPVLPGTVLGRLTPKVQAQVGYDCDVVLPAAHDTGSAFIAIPARDNYAVYLSSGTWSLLGVELDQPLTDPKASDAGFTNEGAYLGRIRLLKNIMGMWILQSIRRENNKAFSYDEMADMAQRAGQTDNPYPGLFDVADNRFMAPDNMTDEIKRALQDAGFAAPQDLSSLLRAVYRSLAEGYRVAIRDLEAVTGTAFTSINIVGGGSRDVVLNQMTADALNLPVYAGPAEGTALGNLICQMIAAGDVESQQQARDMLRKGANVKEYLPRTDR
ncbi:MAG: rhamnulokinase [Christensenellales bacterium]|jgi:rhamnulokinase